MVYVPDENNTILGRNTNKQVFEGLTTGLLKVGAVVLCCLIANRPDGNHQPASPKIPTHEVKNKPSQGDAFSSRVQDLIRVSSGVNQSPVPPISTSSVICTDVWLPKTMQLVTL
ncbi:hypothetical protein P7K49_017326 [Saguinus oedipus]|uniref:Uncharacterized protein n=1 Tax=Saguinus oedipus TaxID=9490 RepID=A0ABQ9V378_SAGOE|nr:hypothetical protein P7K49_017326 [Saguinus oedipus]